MLVLYVLNCFVFDWVRDKYFNNINGFFNDFCGVDVLQLCFEVGVKFVSLLQKGVVSLVVVVILVVQVQIVCVVLMIVCSGWDNVLVLVELIYCFNVNVKYMFDNFVEGKFNQLVCVVVCQVVDNLGGVYNFLFFYGGMGLGKIYLLYVVGNGIVVCKLNVKVVYMYFECFVQDMVKVLQNNVIEEFKCYYCFVDVLLIDDIQFFVNKE